MLPTRSSAGRAQSARRARSSCSRQLPVGSMVSTFTQVPGLEETARSKKTKEQRFLNSSTKILSHLDKRRARKTSTIAVQLLLQNTQFFYAHTHSAPLSPTCSLESMSSITVKDHGSGCPDPCRSHSHIAFSNYP